MQAKIYLCKEQFSFDKKVLFESADFKAEIFRYSTGIEAVKISNDKGYATFLPYMGQMIWDMEFLGKNLVMKSIWREPDVCEVDYTPSYGCFMMHCGLTAMGNPAECDNHLPHGELPVAKYQKAFIVLGSDDKGEYIGLSGVYERRSAYAINYEFSPVVKLYKNASKLDINVNIKNNKDIPLEYYYLCHINYRPFDGAKLIYTAKPENIVVHEETDNPATKAYMKKLIENPAIMNEVDGKTQSYAPEIVFTCTYDADEQGNAYTMQLLPDGYSCYVSHRPEQLPYGIRWISRTEDEDAMGMILPATAEHKGLTYCRERGQSRFIKKGETVSFNFETGILAPEDSQKLKEKINKIMK